MPDYHLTQKAEHDIESITHYTREKWGIDQAIHYLNNI